MTLMDQDGQTPLPEPQEDYSDFSNPSNLLRAPSWIGASPASRPKLVDRAMSAFLSDLEAKRDKVVPFTNADGVVEDAPVWTSAGTLTGSGRDYVEKARQLFQTAAQDPEGGIYKDEFSNKWETSGWVDDLVSSPKQKTFDPLADLENWRSEKAAITTDDFKPAQTWEDFVAFSNAEIKTGEAQIDPNSKELKAEWARRMALSDFDPRTMGERTIDKVGDQYIINPDKYAQIDEVEAEIEALPIGKSEKKMMLLQHRDLVEKHAGTLVNAFAAADAGPLDAIYSRPLNDEFNEAMSKPGASAYEFIKANKERFNKDNYGIAQEVSETFRDALLAGGAAALWLGSAGQLTAPMEALGGLAGDSAKAYNNTKQFDVFGIDINRRDLTDLAGQLGSFVAMGGMGSMAAKGLVKAGAASQSRFIVEGGKLVSRAGAAATAERALIASGKALPKSFGEKALGIAKTIGTDSEVILGSLQSAGMSYGRTFNSVMESTGDRDEAYKEASLQGVGGGLGTFIATSVMNRFAKGAGKFLDGGDGAAGGLVQNIRSRVAQGKVMKETQEVLQSLKSMTPELRKAFSAGLVSSMGETSKKLGLRGHGAMVDIGSEAIEEAMDEVLADAITAIADDSKGWTEAEWDNIQNNWEGYIKAGILGAIGGGAGAVKQGVLNPKQTFGRSEALEIQNGIWKRIKETVTEFDSPGMLALDGRPDSAKSVAEYLADPNPSVEEKAQVLVATARFKSWAHLNSTAEAVPAEAVSPDPASFPVVAPVVASNVVSGTESQPSYAKGTLGELMANAGVSAPEGHVWNDTELGDGPSERMGTFGTATIVQAATGENGEAPHPVAIRFEAPGKEAVLLSKEQAKSHPLMNNSKGKALVGMLENSGTDELVSLLSTKPAPAIAAAPATSQSSGPIVEAPGGAAAVASGSGDTSAGLATEAKSLDVEIDVALDNRGIPSGDFVSDKEFVGEGSESVVYRKGNKAIKVSEPYNENTEEAYQARVDNAKEIDRLVGDGSLQVSGFYRSKNGTKNPIFEQNFVEGRAATEQEVETHMQSRGFERSSAPGKPVTYSKVEGETKITISDLAEGNAFVDENGFTHIIDAGIKKEPPLVQTKAEAPATPAPKASTPKLIQKEESFTNFVKANLRKAGQSASVGDKPVVSQRSIPGNKDGKTRSSHIPELVGLKESGLWIDTEGNATVEPRLMTELFEKHGSAKEATAEIVTRIAALKKSVMGFKTLDALDTKDTPTEGAAIAAIDRDSALVVASNAIENEETDKIGGKWEKIDLRSEQEKSYSKGDAIQDDFGKRIVYSYSPPAGQRLSINVGQLVLIQGEPNSILVLDSVANGKWVFKKVELNPEGISYRTIADNQRNVSWNRTRFVKETDEAIPLVSSIVNGSIELPKLQKLFYSLVAAASPNHTGKFELAELEGNSFLRTDMERGVVLVDMKKLKKELNTIYKNVDDSNAVANEVIASDVVRMLSYWTDEEVLHLLTMQEFAGEENKIEEFYEGVAKMDPENLLHRLLLQTVEERLPGRNLNDEAEDEMSVAAVNGQYMIGAELLRKIHQMKHSGSFAERAKWESVMLQVAINKDVSEEKQNRTGVVKLLNTVAALVKRYSDRVRNILAMRWAVGQLPSHQKAVLMRLERAYKASGAKGDTNYAKEAADERVVEMQREYEAGHKNWGDEITGEHWQAIGKLRELQQNFPDLRFDEMFQEDKETQALSLHPTTREFLREFVSDFADVVTVKDGKEIVRQSPVFEQIEQLLGKINDEGTTLEAENTGLARARKLAFLNYQVLQSKMDLMDFDITSVLDLSNPNSANGLKLIADHIDSNVPKDEQAEYWRQLLHMDRGRVASIQGQIKFIEDALLLDHQAKIERMNPFTSAGRLHILAEAKNVGLASPFAAGAVSVERVDEIMERLQNEVVSRFRALASHSSGMYVPSLSGPQRASIATLKEQLREAQAQATETEAKFIEAKAKAPALNDSMQLEGEGRQRFNQFLEFKQALDTYNKSVRDITHLAFGGLWSPPKEFGLNSRNLNKPTGQGAATRFLESSLALEATSNPDEVFNVDFQKIGNYLGFRPKRIVAKAGERLTKEQEAHNAYREVLDRAANSNAAYVGRMAYVQHYLDYMMGRVPMSSSPDIYQETGGFSLAKTRGENDDVRYRPNAAFRKIDVKAFSALVISAQNEAHAGKNKQNYKRDAINELIEFVKDMESWAKETLALVSNPKDDKTHSPLITEIGGRQTLAGRIKPLIESQFAKKESVKEFDGQQEADGIIPLLSDFHYMLTQSHLHLSEQLKKDGELLSQLRARLDGANDASKLAGKALIEFGDKTWRKNVEDEASRWQREASFDGDNKELGELRNSPIDVRVVSNLAFQIKFHEQLRDYKMGSTFAFEALEAYKSANRGEGTMPMGYHEPQSKRIYLNKNNRDAVPRFAVIQRDGEGNEFYWDNSSRLNLQGNVTDPDAYGDVRTNRADSFDDINEARAGESRMSVGDIAINQEAGPETSMRIWKTTYASIIGSQSSGDRLDVDAGRQFFFDLYELENGRKSKVEAEMLIRKGLRGTFPQMRNKPGEEEFYNALYDKLLAGGLFPPTRVVGNVQIGEAPSLSVETVLVKLLELKRDFEASIIEKARSVENIGRALSTVQLISSPDSVEIQEEFTEDVVTEETNPAFKQWQDSPFSEGKAPAKTIKKTEKVKKTRTIKQSARLSSTMSSVEEAGAIAGLIKGMMLVNTVGSKKTGTSQALNIYDASLLVNGIDGIGNRIMSLLATTVSGETLVVSPTEKQVTQFGLNDVGLKIFRGANGLPNVIYAPQSQKNPETNRIETFGGIAQMLTIAGEDPKVKEQIAALAQTVRETLSPATTTASILHGLTAREQALIDKLPEEERESVREEIRSHMEDVSALGRMLRIDAGSLALFADAGIGSDELLLAELLSNPEAKRLFDQAYVGVDGFENTLLSPINETNIKEGLGAITGFGLNDGFIDEDALANATEESAQIDQEGEGVLMDPNFADVNASWEERMNQGLDDAGEMTSEQESEMLSMVYVRGPEYKDDDRNEKPRKRNRFGPDAQAVNGRLKNLLGSEGLNPSDAFLFNGLARILELGKAAGGLFPQSPDQASRTTREVLSNPRTRNEAIKTQAGPMLQGGMSNNMDKANAIYVGEMRNLTMPKVDGSTAAHIAFDFRRIQSTNASVLLRAGAVRDIVGPIAMDHAINQLETRSDATTLGRISVDLPLTDEMLASIEASLPYGMMAQALADARESLAGLEEEEERLRREELGLMAQLAAAEADAGEWFQALLDNSPEGANLLATADEWSQSLREQTRDMVVAHVSRFAESLAEKVERSDELGHKLYTTLSQSLANNPEIMRAVDGMYDMVNKINGMIPVYYATLDAEAIGSSIAPKGSTKEILKRMDVFMQVFNFYGMIFNAVTGIHARQALKFSGVDPSKVNLKPFSVKTFKRANLGVTKKEMATIQGSLSGILNEEKFADGFITNLVKAVTQAVASSPSGMNSFSPKKGLNQFLVSIAKESRDAGDLKALIEERINEVLDGDNENSEEFTEALREIAMTTAEARYILSTAKSAEQRDERLQTEARLKTTQDQLKRTTETLANIDKNDGKVPVGMGYYSNRVVRGDGKTLGGKLRPALDQRVVVGTRLTLVAPPEGSVNVSTGLGPVYGTMSQRDFWVRSTAVTRALTGYSEDVIDDAYKFVRNTTEQFMSFDPLKAINQAVALVETQNLVAKQLVEEGRSDAERAKWKGMSAAAIAALTDPSEAMLLVKSAKRNVRQINTPKGWRERRDLIGQLVENEGESLILLPLDAKELLMNQFPKKFNKRNVNSGLKNMVLDALPTNPSLTYSHFLAGTEKEAGLAFDGTGFSPTKAGLNKGEAAKAFAADWREGMKIWLNDAMNKKALGSTTTKTVRTDGDLYQASENTFSYMIERLVISHKDSRLSDATLKKINDLLLLIDSKEFSKIGTKGPGSGEMDVRRMLNLRVETVFSEAFSQIEEEAIRQRITTGFVSFDGKVHSLELGALKFLHHQDARMRAQFRKSYAARQAGINLTAFLEYGIDGKSGRIGYTIAKKKMEDDIAAAAAKAGPNAKNQTIGYLLAVIKGTDNSFAMSKGNAANAFLRDLQRGLNQLANLDIYQKNYFGTDKKGFAGILAKGNRYWNAHNIDLVRDAEMGLWLRKLMKDNKIDQLWTQDDDLGQEMLDKFAAALEAEIEDGKQAEVKKYTEKLGESFQDISSAMQLTMAMLSREAAVNPVGEPWQDDKRDAYKETYSSVPLRIGFAAQPDPKKRATSASKFISDPADLVSFKDASFFGGYGRHEFYYNAEAPLRPININGLTAPLSLVDDAVYRLNVTPTYEVLRRSFGRSKTNSNGVASIEDGHFLEKAEDMRPVGDMKDPAFREQKSTYEKNLKHFKEALSGIATEIETVMQNDAANGVLNTGGAEVMRFLGSLYIVRSLASIQQLWDQGASPSVGYSLGKISVGKGKQASQFFGTLGRLLTDKKFRDAAREWVKRVDPMVYYRAADGADITRAAMRGQTRFGKSKIKNQTGKWLRQYEELGELALDKTIGTTERFMATAIYLTELQGFLGASYAKTEDLFALHPDDIPHMDKTNARRKVSDVMAQSDQGRKSWMFQNRTSSPARNALWRSLVRFSNHTASTSSNTAVLVPVFFDQEADPETKAEARENVVTTLAQNILFNPFKLRTLIPLLLYVFFLPGDDDDEAQEKAQELANRLMFSDEDDNILQDIYKALFFGKQREMFQQDKDPDAAQASAVAEILSKAQVELLTTIPIFGALVGYSPISGLMEKAFTNPLSISQATNLNNMVNRKNLNQASSPYDANAVTIREYEKSWDESLVGLTAPTQTAYDLGAALKLSAEFNMTDYSANRRMASLLETAYYLIGTEALPFAREPRSQQRARMREIVRKEKKKNR